MGDNHGRVTSRAKCPKCGGRSWDLTGEHGFDLLKCRSCGQLSNKLPIIRLSWENADLTIVYGRMGNRLTTVEDAVTELKLIRQAIQAEDFDPEDYAGENQGLSFLGQLAGQTGGPGAGQGGNRGDSPLHAP